MIESEFSLYQSHSPTVTVAQYIYPISSNYYFYTRQYELKSREKVSY